MTETGAAVLYRLPGASSAAGVAQAAMQPLADEGSQRRRRFAPFAVTQTERLVGALVPVAVDSLDIDAIVRRVDVDAVIGRVDVDALVQRVATRGR